MKKRNLLLLFTLPALALCGCTIGKKDIPEEQKEEPATNADTENLDGNDYDDWANSWSKPGHLYFHYNRGSSAADYNNYCLWVWPFYPDSLEGTLWGYGGKTQVSDTLTLKPMSTAIMTTKDVGLSGDVSPYKDKFGVIYDVDLENTNLVGGKTGTANMKDGRSYNTKKVRTSFVGVFPITDPKYAVQITLSDPKVIPETNGFNNAGWNAKPVGLALINELAPYLNVAPVTDYHPPEFVQQAIERSLSIRNKRK